MVQFYFGGVHIHYVISVIEDAITTRLYEGDSNEKIKSAIKIQNTARLSCKLTIMILMV
jgi:hypothetical protein